MGFGFTGEQTDASGLVDLRARYYVPGLGVFPSLDPVEEGNRYGYVGGDVVNRVDPSGMVGERPEMWMCLQPEDPCAFCYDPRFGIGREPLGIAACIALCEEQHSTRRATDSKQVTLKRYADELYACISGPNCPFGPQLQPKDAVHALQLLIMYAGTLYRDTTIAGVVDVLSYILVGSGGMATIYKEGSSLLGDSGYEGASDAHRLALADAHSLHRNYYKSEGQIYHFWSYLNSAAQGGTYFAELADIYHECLELKAGNKAGTPEDARLTTIAVRIGVEVNAQQHTPKSLADRIGNALTTGFQGELLPHYSEVPSCWWLKELEARTR